MNAPTKHQFRGLFKDLRLAHVPIREPPIHYVFKNGDVVDYPDMIDDFLRNRAFVQKKYKPDPLVWLGGSKMILHVQEICQKSGYWRLYACGAEPLGWYKATIIPSGEKIPDYLGDFTDITDKVFQVELLEIEGEE